MIHIVTDSSADLAPEFKRNSSLTVVPLNVIFGDHVFRGGVDISSFEFFEKLRAHEGGMPKTSMPSPQVFMDAYRGLHDTAETIVSIHISSKLSGTYQSAVAAMAEHPNHDIVVIDSGLVSVGLHLLVTLCLREVAAGADRDTLLRKLDGWKKAVGMFFVPETLEYLRRGGRIGRASELAGSLLNIKPLLTMRDGVVDTAAKARSRRKALTKIVEEMTSRLPLPHTVVIAHAADSPALEEFAAEILNALPEIELVKTEIGPVTGAHTGPGTISAAFV